MKVPSCMKPVDLRALRCLIVDDNAHIRRVVRMLLQGFGIREVIEAEDGGEGLELFQTNAPDFVILDWAMPVLNGIELTLKLRDTEISNFPYVPIIMITGHSDKKRVIEARDSGVTEFVCKPISAKALYQRILVSVVSPRSFIRTESFFGPDRRRIVGGLGEDAEERRGKGDSEHKVTKVNRLIEPRSEKSVA